jgi:hypothetical protein
LAGAFRSAGFGGPGQPSRKIDAKRRDVARVLRNQLSRGASARRRAATAA